MAATGARSKERGLPIGRHGATGECMSHPSGRSDRAAPGLARRRSLQHGGPVVLGEGLVGVRLLDGGSPVAASPMGPSAGQAAVALTEAAGEVVRRVPRAAPVSLHPGGATVWTWA
ncbi:hypothetical protein GCM10028783_29940 [Modestobacter muralis]